MISDEDRRGPHQEDGFSLIELVVAMGIFSLLMVIIGALSISAFGAIREATSRSEIQTRSQNAMEWTSRLLRYADSPEDGSAAIFDASPTGLSAYTYAGTGDVPDVPSRVRIFAEPQLDGSTAVVSEVIEPARVNGEWVWTGTPTRRTLLTIDDAVGSPLGIEYYVCDPEDGCTDPQEFTPTGSGPLLPSDSTLVPAYLVISLGDPSVPNTRVTQTVKLVNQS